MRHSPGQAAAGVSEIPPSSPRDGQLPPGSHGGGCWPEASKGSATGPARPAAPAVRVPIAGSPGCHCWGRCHWVGAGSPGRGLWCVPSPGTQGGGGTLVSPGSISTCTPSRDAGHSGARVLPGRVLGGCCMGPPGAAELLLSPWEVGICGASLGGRGGRGVPRGLIQKLRLCCDSPPKPGGG